MTVTDNSKCRVSLAVDCQLAALHWKRGHNGKPSVGYSLCCLQERHSAFSWCTMVITTNWSLEPWAKLEQIKGCRDLPSGQWQFQQYKQVHYHWWTVLSFLLHLSQSKWQYNAAATRSNCHKSLSYHWINAGCIKIKEMRITQSPLEFSSAFVSYCFHID